jgi:hypothetical protein
MHVNGKVVFRNDINPNAVLKSNQMERRQDHRVGNDRGSRPPLDQAPRPAHCRQRRCSPRFDTEHLEQTALRQAVQAWSALMP